MSRWFRLYGRDVLNDPKVQRLSPPLFKAWVNILCAASENDGIVPDLGDLAFMLRKSEETVGNDVAALVAAGLLDEMDGIIRPHNWDGRQFKADVSTERVQRHRKRLRNVTSTVSETPPETETETDITDANASVVIAPKKPDDGVPDAVKAFNAVAAESGWPVVRVLTRPREASLRKLLAERGGDGWAEILARARASPFLCGTNDHGWRAGIDFLLRPSSIAKLLEGSYDDKPAIGRAGQTGARPRESVLEGVARAAEARLREYEREADLDGGLSGDDDPGAPDRGSGLTIEGELSGRPS